MSLPPSAFNVEFKTEWVEIEIAEDSFQRIPLDSVRYNTDFFSDKDLDSLDCFSGSFKPNPGSIIQFERVLNSKLKIYIHQPENSSQNYTGDFYTLDDRLSFSATDFVEFYYDIDEFLEKNKSLIIPFRGKVMLNRNPYSYIANSSPSVLKSGIIRIVGKSLINKDFYEGNTHELHLGDQVRLEDKKDDLVNSYGFIYVGKEPGFQVVYKSLAEKARIYTPGPSNKEASYTLEPSLLSRFENDGFFKWTALIIAAILFYASIIEGTNESDAFIERQFPKKKKKKKKTK